MHECRELDSVSSDISEMRLRATSGARTRWRWRRRGHYDVAPVSTLRVRALYYLFLVLTESFTMSLMLCLASNDGLINTDKDGFKDAMVSRDV